MVHSLSVIWCKSCTNILNKFSAPFLIVERVKHLANEKVENMERSQAQTLSQTRSVTQLCEMLDVLSVQCATMKRELLSLFS